MEVLAGSPAVRIIGLRERTWASKRFQNFLGQFHLCTKSGIYFDGDTQSGDWLKILQAMKCVPTPLLKNARAVELTMSTCEGLTPNGNSSTTYAQWSCRDLKDGSPHIVMGSTSLTPELIVPHLVHELCHLYFATAPLNLQEAWMKMICDAASVHMHEVTEYTQEYHEAWLEQRDNPHRDKARALREEIILRRYTVEAFCETVATLVEPRYLHAQCNVDMAPRLEILNKMGLSL